MLRGASRWGRAVALAACCLPVAAGAQAVPAPARAPDSVRTAAPTFVADTARHVAVVSAAEPSPAVTRPRALRIGAAIVLLTLTTLLLYNVRSR